MSVDCFRTRGISFELLSHTHTVPLFWSSCPDRFLSIDQLVCVDQSERSMCDMSACEIFTSTCLNRDAACYRGDRLSHLSVHHPSGQSAVFSTLFCFLSAHAPRRDVLIDTMSYFLTSVGRHWRRGHACVRVCVCERGVKSGAGGTSSSLGEGGAGVRLSGRLHSWTSGGRLAVIG